VIMITSFTDERATYDQQRSQDEEPKGNGCCNVSRLPPQTLKQLPKQHRRSARQKKPPSDLQTSIKTGQAELWYPCSIICCGFDSEDSRSASLLQASYDVSDYSVSFLRDFVGNRSLIPDSGLFDCLSSLASYGFLVIREARKLR